MVYGVSMTTPSCHTYLAPHNLQDLLVRTRLCPWKALLNEPPSQAM